MVTSSMESGMADVKGARIWYETIGRGKPIVLVHAGIADARMWDAQVEAFAQDHLVARYDMRGFGRSSIPPEPYAHHEDLRGVFEVLGFDRAILIGASYGGNVATEFALEHPERVRALILVNSLVGMETPSSSLRAGWDAVNAAMDAGDVERAVELETEMWVDGPYRRSDQVDPHLRELVTSMNAALFARAEEQEAAEEQGLEPEARERLGEIQVPALVVVGEIDQPDALDSADALVNSIPNARKATMPNSAHLPSMERPEEFNRIVREFIDTLS